MHRKNYVAKRIFENLAPFKQLRWWPEPLTSTKHWQFVWSTEWSFWINQRQEWRQRMYIVQGSNIFCITHEKDHWTCCTWKWKWSINIKKMFQLLYLSFLTDLVPRPDRGQLFEDQDFPPGNKAIYSNKKPGLHPILWMRPHVSSCCCCCHCWLHPIQWPI